MMNIEDLLQLATKLATGSALTSSVHPIKQFIRSARLDGEKPSESGGIRRDRLGRWRLRRG